MILISNEFENFRKFINYAYESIVRHWKTNIDIVYSDTPKVQASEKTLYIIPAKKIFSSNFMEKMSIPNNVVYFKNFQEPIPIVFASSEPFVERKGLALITNIDLLETYFFFLSCYEEIVIKDRDKYGRFPEDLSTPKRLGFFHLPILDMLRKLFLNLLDENLDIPNSVLITHDVDRLKTRYSLRHSIKRVLKLEFHPILSYIKDLIKGGLENTIDNILEFERLKKIESIFFFMVRKGNMFIPDSDYSPNKLLKILKGKKIKVGLHPSLRVRDIDDILKEKKILESIIGESVEYVRMHYLRYDPFYTFEMLEQAGFKYDSSIGYPSGFGYKCGTAYTFRIFNWRRKKRGIIEFPLILMDNTEDVDKIKTWLRRILKNTKEYGGEIVINLHNDFYLKHYLAFQEVYDELTKGL